MRLLKKINQSEDLESLKKRLPVIKFRSEPVRLSYFTRGSRCSLCRLIIINDGLAGFADDFFAVVFLGTFSNADLQSYPVQYTNCPRDAVANALSRLVPVKERSAFETEIVFEERVTEMGESGGR